VTPAFHTSAQEELTMPIVRLATNLEIAYELTGTPTDAAIVLIAGLGDQLLVWSETFCGELRAAGFRVLRFDNRDVGLSTKFSSTYAIEDMANDVCLLMDALQIESAHIVGCSLGGMVAQKLAIANPGRLKSMALLQTFNGDKSAWKPQPEAMEAMATPAPQERHRYIEHARRLARIIGSPGTEDIAAEYAAATFDRGLHLDGVENQSRAVETAKDWSSTLRSLNVPTLIVHGGCDPFFPPACAQATARSIRNATLHILPGRGHDLPWGVEVQVAQLIVDHARRSNTATAPARPQL
jgi:pimeloyl-ACP methyl ester carboxylesterase